MGKPVDRLVNVPTLGGEDIQLGFNVLPLDESLNVVEVSNNPPPKRSPSPQFAFPQAQISRLASTINVANPVSRQGQATFFSGPPLIPLLHPVPPPRVVIIEEPEQPEPKVINLI